MVAAVVDVVLHPSVKRHAHAEIRATDQPWVVVRQPGVGDLHLAALDEGLAEQTELVMDAVTDGRDIQRRQRIQEAGGEAAEAAVAEAHVGLFFRHRLQVLPEALQGGPRDLAQAEVHEVVGEDAPHQVFQGEVIDAPDVLGGVHRLRRDVTLQHLVAGGHAGRRPPIIARGRDRIPREGAFQVAENRFAERGDRRHRGGRRHGRRLGLAGNFGARLGLRGRLDRAPGSGLEGRLLLLRHER